MSTDADLIAKLRHDLRKYNHGGITHTLLTEAADRLEELSAWRPIAEAPPNSLARLVWCPERQNAYVVTWSKDIEQWVHFGSWLVLVETPTLWLPLPPPPQTGESA